MAKRRKSVASRLDEAERTMYSSFSTAANSLSHLYSQAMNHQKISFHEGECHALEKLHQWILRKHEEGSELTVDDIFSHVQNELDHGGEDALPSQIQHHLMPSTHFANLGNQTSCVSSGQTGGHTPGHGHSHERTKTLMFSNAFPTLIRRNLQQYQLSPQGGGSHQSNILPTSIETQNPEMSSTDTSMDMH